MSFDPVSYAMGRQAGGGGSVTVEALSVTENGTYTAAAGEAYNPVEVDVPDRYLDGYSEGYREGYDSGHTDGYGAGYDEGYGAGEANERSELLNGNTAGDVVIYDEDLNEYALAGQNSETYTENGTYDTTLNNSVTVEVLPALTPFLSATVAGLSDIADDLAQFLAGEENHSGYFSATAQGFGGVNIPCIAFLSGSTININGGGNDGSGGAMFRLVIGENLVAFTSLYQIDNATLSITDLTAYASAILSDIQISLY